jgi:hypothetical protein
MSQYLNSDDLSGMTAMVHQYDRNPGKGESIVTAIAQPDTAWVAAEALSLARTRATSVNVATNPRPVIYAHRDRYRDQNDAASIKAAPTNVSVSPNIPPRTFI